jgi:hypothetical protein
MGPKAKGDVAMTPRDLAQALKAAHEARYTVQDVKDVLATAEDEGWITEAQVAQLAGLFVAAAMVRP